MMMTGYTEAKGTESKAEQKMNKTVTVNIKIHMMLC